MKRVTFIALALTISLLFLVGCASSGKVTTSSAEEGAVLELMLESNPTTGCSWMVKVLDEKVAVFEESEYMPGLAPEGMVGVGGFDVLKFRIVGEGETKVLLRYGHAWAPDEVYEERTAIIKATADLDGTIELVE